jgi:hypothetical protein
MRARAAGISTLEVVVVLVVLTLLASTLLQRLGGLSAEARQVQLRMTVENVRSNAILLQMRCGNAPDPTCWQQAVATALRAGVGGLPPAPAAAETVPPERANAIGRLRTIALAAGLGEHGAKPPVWALRPEGDTTLWVGLKAVPDCRFSMHWVAASAAVTVQHVADRC